MTQEDKKILFQDLATRLPYMVKVKVWLKDGTTEEGPLDLGHNYADVLLDAFYYNKIKDIKPYLRPISSMTEDERKEYELLANHCIVTSIGFIHLEVAQLTDWLNAHHFDFRNLIEKGLAIEVTEENNPYK